MSLKCINKPHEGHQTGVRPGGRWSPVLLTSAKSKFLPHRRVQLKWTQKGGFWAHGLNSLHSVWILRTIEDILGVKWDRRPGFPSPSITPLTAQEEKWGSGATPHSKAHVLFLVFECTEAKGWKCLSCVPSGRFPHCPSPSCSHFVMKVLIVPRTIFLFLRPWTCF